MTTVLKKPARTPTFQEPKIVSTVHLTMPPETFSDLSRLLHDLTGINLPLNEKNMTLMAGRISSALRSRNLNSYEEYRALVTKNPTAEVIKEFISSMTTNTTEFFRENKHFDVLTRHLPDLMKKMNAKGSNELRVWCSAASTGQEPLSILMTLLEARPELTQWNFKFLATDIDIKVLQTAARGLYTPSLLSGVPPMHKQKYFQPTQVNEKPMWQARPEVLELIRYAPLNLDDDAYPFQHQFQIIFCRNVLIYFNRERAERVVEQLASHLSVGGMLFLGHAESGVMKSNNLESVAHAVYVKTAAGKRAR